MKANEEKNIYIYEQKDNENILNILSLSYLIVIHGSYFNLTP